MKIGIDISQIVYGTGVSCYTKNLVRNLVKIDKMNQYLLFGGSFRQKKVLKDFVESLDLVRARGVIWPVAPSLADFFWNQLHILEIEKLIGKIEVFHSSDWTQPPTRAAKVTTIHDLAIFKFPEAFPKKITAVHQRRLAWVKKEADLIIAVSESTKKDIVSFLGIPEKKIKVIYEAAPEEIKQVGQEKIEKAKRKYKIKGDYLLSVSTLEPRKNLQRTIEAFRLLKTKNLTLVVAGKIGWGEALKLTRNTILTGFVPDEDLSALYSGALVYLYPSLYEGFGQNILEAMVCGCPVVTSNVSSMPEVAGKAAVLVDPFSVESIAEGIKRAINNRSELVKAGFEQMKKFSWEKCALQTLEAYEEAAR